MDSEQNILKSICDGYIIAEIGKNHNGDVEIAKRMIKAAAECGVDAVKFQSLQAEKLVIQEMEKVAHLEGTIGEQSVFEMIKSVELSREDHFALAEVAGNEGVEFISTPEDLDMVDLLEDVGVKFYKIASLDLTFIPLIEKVAKTGKPLVISTGMATLGEIDEVLALINRCNNNQVVLLHCVSSYPPPVEESGLNAIPYLESVFGIPIGYSDHSMGVWIPVAAAALGAVLIEKHFTLDKNMQGPDHRISADPTELKLLVEGVREVRKALGLKNKRLAPSELEMRKNVRRKMVASRNVSKGACIEKDMIEFKSSAVGLEPKYYETLIGCVLQQDMQKDQVFNWNAVSSK